MVRRIRNRAPTYTSTMLDDFDIISISCPNDRGGAERGCDGIN
jgi:hypothetical protein